ncbi:MAG: hypothetical protein ACRC62_04885 [Microcoleus sp.]
MFLLHDGGRKKEEGRRKKEEGRGKKEEGRRKREEGRGKKEEEKLSHFPHSRSLPLSHSFMLV